MIYGAPRSERRLRYLSDDAMRHHGTSSTHVRRRGTTSACIALAMAGVLGGGGACARHDADPAFRSSVAIGDRGISVPLPPPSLFDVPKQSVDVVVEIQGDGELAPGVELRLVDNDGALDESLVLDDVVVAPEGLVLEGLPIDLTQNCLELWLTDGEIEGAHTLYHATIGADGRTVETVSGCR